MKVWYKLSNEEAKYLTNKELALDSGVDLIPSLIDFPNKGLFLAWFLFILLYPLHLLMHLTIPDLRLITKKDSSKISLSIAVLIILLCPIWLIVGSYVMVVSLESPAKKLSVPNTIIGATVSVAGTSLPNHVSSTVPVREGRGDMAIGNTFGSNTFNLTMGLGLQWTLYIIFTNKIKPYHRLHDEGIISSVLILLYVLLIFIILMKISDCILYRWHGYLFFTLFIVYIIQVVYHVS